MVALSIGRCYYYITNCGIVQYAIPELKKNRHQTTPDYVREVLTKTNHYGNIKQILIQITQAANDPENDEFENNMELRRIAKQYKEVLLEMVDAREHAPSNLKTIKKIAHAGGYLKELEALDAKPKIYGHSENKVLYATFRSDVERDLSPFDTIIVDTNLENFFISSADNIKQFHILKAFNLTFIQTDLRDATINVPSTTNITYHSSYIDLSHLELPANSITLEASTNVSDKRNQDTINFQARNVTLDSTTSLRKEILDFSQTEKVTISGGLYNVKKLIFKPNSVVSLNYCSNFPQTMDLSMCKNVFLYHADLAGVSEITFTNETQKNRFLDGAYIRNNINYKYSAPSLTSMMYDPRII
jgi:hypothetical protein